VNHELVALYWDIGQGIVEKQKTLGWGESVVEMVAADLRTAFPDMTGFSPRNVWDMKRLYEAYSAPDFLSQAVREVVGGRKSLILRQPVAEWGKDEKRHQLVTKLEKSDPMQFLRQLPKPRKRRSKGD